MDTSRIIRTEFPKDKEEFIDAFNDAFKLAEKMHKDNPDKFHFVEVEVPGEQVMNITLMPGNYTRVCRIGQVSFFIDYIKAREGTVTNIRFALFYNNECTGFYYMRFPVESAITVSELEEN